MKMARQPFVSLLFGGRHVYINAALAFFAFCAVFVFGSARVDAATLAVSGGCTLTAAADSVNAGSDQGSCVATGAYGTDDTISLPAGVHALPSMPTISKPVVLEGVGSDQSIIDIGTTQDPLNFQNTSGSIQQVTIRDLAMRGSGNSMSAWIASYDFSTTIQRVELYGTSVPGDPTDQLIVIGGGAYSGQVNLVEDVYIHDITLEATVIGLSPNGAQAMDDNTVRRVTIHDIDLTSMAGASVVSFGGTMGGSISALVENITVQDINFAAQGAVVVAPAIATGAADMESNVVLRNSTLRYTKPTTTSTDSMLAGTYAVAVDGRTAESTMTLQNNVLITNGYAPIHSCGVNIMDLGGTTSSSIVSLGGNLTDDDACDAYLTQPTDQTEVSGLAATLGTLEDNGGLTPTAALLAGSPAIDAGVTVAGLTTDQRGTVRPQGAAYDSGAFELAAADLGDDDDDGDDGDSDGEGDENNDDDVSAGSGNGQDQAGSGDRLANTGAGIAKIVLLASTIISVAVALTYRTRKNLLYTLFR